MNHLHSNTCIVVIISSKWPWLNISKLKVNYENQDN